MTGIFKKHNLIILSFILLAVVTHGAWFILGTILTHGDWQYRTDEYVRQMVSISGTWLNTSDFGGANITLYSYPLRGIIWSILSNVNLSYDTVVKLSMFIPIAILGFVGPYLLVKKLTRSQLIAVAIALFYGTTTYFLRKQTNHLPFAFIYALTPLLFYFYLSALKDNKTTTWLGLSLFGLLVTIYDVRILLIIGMILGIYFLVMHMNLKDIKRYARNSIVAGVAFLLLSAYWLLPTITGGLGGDIGSITGGGLFGDELFNISYALTLHEYSWTGAEPNLFFVPQSIAPFFWFIPILAFSPFLFIRKYSAKGKKYLIYFALITLLGIFLTKQSSEPFAYSYKWIYDTIPGFSIFREASKFYLLTAFGYLGLLSLALVGLCRLFKEGSKRFIGLAAIAVLVILAGINLKPLVTGEVGTLFVSRTIPQDYKTLGTFMAKQKEYFRTYWVPSVSRWNSYSTTHPQLSGANIAQSSWNEIGSSHSMETGQKMRDVIMEPFSKPYADKLFDYSSVKYVIVPLRDTQNDDDFFRSYGNSREYFINELNKRDFLTRIDIGTKDIVVYENKDYQQNITSFNQLSQVSDIKEMETLYNRNRQLMNNSDLHFTSDQKATYPSTKIDDVFSNLQPKNLNSNQVSVELNSSFNNRNLSVSNRYQLYYEIKNDQLSIYRQDRHALTINQQPTTSSFGSSKEIIQTTSINNDDTFFLVVNNKVTILQPIEGVHLLGESNDDIKIVKNANVHSPIDTSFEIEAFDASMTDCSTGDRQGAVIMSTNDAPQGSKILSLSSKYDTACIELSTPSLTQGQYIISFDAKSADKNPIDLSIRFKGSEHVLKDVVRPADNDWHTYRKIITTPVGASLESMQLSSSSSLGSTKSVDRYIDEVKISLVDEVATIPRTEETFETVALGKDRQTVTYRDDSISESNVLRNPSFEGGTWNKKVSDCSAYDNNPKIDMMLNKQDKTQGRQSLELSARRHVACTSQNNIPVSDNNNYLFSFDYQNLTDIPGGYSLKFNDPERTTMQGRLEKKDSKWHNLTRNIDVPQDATSVSLTIYAYSDGYGFTNNITRYDNFSILATPSLRDFAYVVEENPYSNLSVPKETKVKNISPVENAIEVKNASNSFYLSFSESYHKGWAVESPPGGSVSAINQSHFKLNDFSNGWFIDIKELCKKEGACVKQSDGTYNINLSLKFKPQQKFYLGLIISGISLLAVIVFMYVSKKKREE